MELADTLVADFDVVELLTRLADRCVDVLGVCRRRSHVGRPGRRPTGDGLLQRGHAGFGTVRAAGEEGPCLDCYRSGRPVVAQDLAMVDGRWPRFATEALAAGFRSVHALPMRLRGAVIGALNLFHLEAGEMQSADVEAAQALADVATIAILQHRATLQAKVVNQQLQSALNSRIVIEQAKGIVAERESLNMEQAFSALRHHARNHNLRLVDVAEAVIAGSRLRPPWTGYSGRSGLSPKAGVTRPMTILEFRSPAWSVRPGTERLSRVTARAGRSPHKRR